LSAHRGAIRTRLRVAREGHGGYGLDLAPAAIQTGTAHAGAHDVRSLEGVLEDRELA